MKIAIALLVVAVAVASADYVDHGDGRPGCIYQEEIELKYWRNNWDSNQYWVCKTLGEAGELEHCQVMTGGASWWFNPNTRACEPWDNWVWVDASAPLSKPGDVPEETGSETP